MMQEGFAPLRSVSYQDNSNLGIPKERITNLLRMTENQSYLMVRYH